MLLATEEEVCILGNMICKIKSIALKIKTSYVFLQKQHAAVSVCHCQ